MRYKDGERVVIGLIPVEFVAAPSMPAAAQCGECAFFADDVRCSDQAANCFGGYWRHDPEVKQGAVNDLG